MDSSLLMEHLDKIALTTGWAAVLLTAAAAGAGVIAWLFALGVDAKKHERARLNKETIASEHDLHWLQKVSLVTGSCAVLLTVAAAGAGLISWHFSSVVGAMKDDRANQLEKNALKAKVELASLKKAQGPRRLDTNAFVEKLKGTLRRKVEILYQPGDVEAHDLAAQIFEALLKSSWAPPDPLASIPQPIPANASRTSLRNLPPQLFNAMLPIERLAPLTHGVSIMANQTIASADAPQKPLAIAIAASEFIVIMGMIPELQDNTLLVIVGPK